MTFKSLSTNAQIDKNILIDYTEVEEMRKIIYNDFLILLKTFTAIRKSGIKIYILKIINLLQNK